MQKHLIHRAERGQALLMIVVGMVAMLAFTAMSIDGGVIYADRRDAQNAADQAAMAGAIAHINNGLPHRANCLPFSGNSENFAKCYAIESVIDNGYATNINRLLAIQSVVYGGSVTDASGDVVAVSVSSPAPGSYAGQLAGDVLMQVTIHHTTETALIQLFTSGDFRHTVTAIARASSTPGSGGGGGDNAVLLPSGGCSNNIIEINNYGQLNINGGSLHTNSTCNTSLFVTGHGQINAASVSTASSAVSVYNNGQINPSPITSAPAQTNPYVGVITAPSNPYPTCTASVGLWGSNNSTTINPGCYTNVQTSGNGNVINMQPGIYVINNLGIYNGATLNIAPGGTVLILGNSGMSGNNTQIVLNETMVYHTGSTFGVDNYADFYHTPPTSGTYAGVALYKTGGTIQFTGYTELFLDGIYYAPNAAFAIHNHSIATLDGAELVVRSVHVTGHAIVNMTGGGGGAPPEHSIDLLQ